MQYREAPGNDAPSMQNVTETQTDTKMQTGTEPDLSSRHPSDEASRITEGEVSHGNTVSTPPVASSKPVNQVTVAPSIDVPASSEEPGYVDDSWFDDACFIGDSRTVAIEKYGHIDNATFYCSTGLTVYKLFTDPIVEVPGGKPITIEEALSQEHFRKIYFMIGINEMGTGTVESFARAYGEAVAHLEELQPDADIYLQANLRVTTKRSNKGDYINNPGIDARNAACSVYADGERVFWLDTNPLFCDEDGGLNPEYTGDSIHLKARYLPFWVEYLKENAHC